MRRRACLLLPYRRRNPPVIPRRSQGQGLAWNLYRLVPSRHESLWSSPRHLSRDLYRGTKEKKEKEGVDRVQHTRRAGLIVRHLRLDLSRANYQMIHRLLSSATFQLASSDHLRPTFSQPAACCIWRKNSTCDQIKRLERLVCPKSLAANLCV